MKTTAPVRQLVNGFVPVALVDIHTPRWASDAASNLHGSHKVIGHRNAILVTGEMRNIPLGDWIITYTYDDNEGIGDIEVWVAAELN